MERSEICRDRVVAVTGAGRGIGRAYALALAAAGAKVVVNDLGGERDGRGASDGPAQGVVDEIVEAGGQAVAHARDIAQSEHAQGLVELAIERFGRLDAVVNNAGIDRPALITDCDDDDWAAVLDIHLGAQFRVLRAAGRHWRSRAEAGEEVRASAINTSSPAAIMGFRGEGAYSAAKAAVLALTLTAADELGDFGVAVNAVVPGAATRLTDWSPGAPPPDKIAPLIVWLSSTAANDVRGRVFSAAGGIFMLLHGWEAGEPVILGDGDADTLGNALRDRLANEREPAEVLAPGRNLAPRPGAPGNLA